MRLLVKQQSSVLQFALIVSLIKIDDTRDEEKMKIVHEKKLNRLLEDKAKSDGLKKNPNETIVNLTGEFISDAELSILKTGLNFSVSTSPKEAHMCAAGESLFDQIIKHNLIDKSNTRIINRVKTSIKAFTFSYLDIDNSRLAKDKKIIKAIKLLRDKYTILRSDKGSSVVILNKADYFNSVTEVFSDKSKFSVVTRDDTLTRLSSVQNFLRKMKNRDEINDEEYKSLTPKNANAGRAYGLPKIHKPYEHLPKFRPIIDCTGSPYKYIGKFICNLLSPLTQNAFALKDSFDAANKIKEIPRHLFDEGYKFISFDVVSLFTNVPLLFTTNLILKKVFEEKLITTNLRKRTLKKLILDSCTKTIFSFNDILYKQIDGVAMGSILGPLLSNIIMADLETTVIQPLISSNIIKFYGRYVDDTLVLIKPEYVSHVHNLLNNYHTNLQFTVDTFDNESVHFLDLLILDDLNIDIYRKSTFTGNYINYDSFVPWYYKISWIRSIIFRAKNICTNSILFSKQLRQINDYMSWNGFPRHARKSIVNKILEDQSKNKSRTESPTRKVLWFNIPYLGQDGEFLVKKLRRKLKRYLSVDFDLRVSYSFTKLSMFCSMKDKIDTLNKANVIYEFSCPSCFEKYIGMTERNLLTRLKEHGNGKSDSAINIHLQNCPSFNDSLSYFEILNDNSICKDKHISNTILSNTKILDFHRNWFILSYLESFYIKYFKPTLNTGTRAAKELQMF